MAPASLYVPLNEAKDEIRVLQFSCSSSSPAAKNILSMTMHHVFLEQFRRPGLENGKASWRDIFSTTVDNRHDVRGRFLCGDFEALSYAWGENDKSRAILLNGQAYQVSRTLEAALNCLQRRPETKDGMMYWIDALCINQSDVEERNHQVKRLRRVYLLARAVIVWMGEASQKDTRAVELIKATYRDPEQNFRLIPPHFTADDWDYFCSFLSNPYWGRLWIIQELALNHRATLFLCGNLQLSRDMLKTGTDCCQKLLREHLQFSSKTYSNMWEAATRIYRLVDLSSARSSSSMFNTALSLARQVACSDYRDKVYGILGLIDDSISSKIQPDYKKTVEQVFTEMKIAIIKATGSLEQIVYQSSPANTALPTWVPDLRRPFPRHHVKCLRKRKFNKRPGAIYRFTEEKSSRRLLLVCKGYQIDHVDGISASQNEGSTPIQPEYKTFLDDVHDKSHARQGIRAVGRTLVMDHDKTRQHPSIMKISWVSGDEQQSAPSSWGPLFTSSSFREFDKFRQANKDFRIGDVLFRDLFPSNIGKIKIAEVMSYHARLAVTALQGRRFITTKTGLIGVVPDSVQQGDTLAILLGCNFPVLLRQDGAHYQVLGECYVYGMMNGYQSVTRQDGNAILSDFHLI